MEKPPGLLTNSLRLKNKVYEVTLDRAQLTWKKSYNKKNRVSRSIENASKVGSVCVPVCEILSVRETEADGLAKNGRRWPKSSQKPSEAYPHAFTVSHVERVKHHRWRCKDVTFHCRDVTVRQKWVQTIRERLSTLTGRPKHLLVYINPYGGKKRGKQIYEEKVAPLFQRASISTSVIVTERANHARDHLKTDADLKKYDGVVCVGGDGMFSEVLHGLISRTQRDAGVDQNRREEKPVPCGIRIGIIPAGSTDCICYATVGTNDPVTSALHIIVGDSQPLDICSVHHGNTFLRYSVSLLGYGFYGDVLTDSERRRWMGPVRYDFAGLKMFLTHNHYEGTVSFLPATEMSGTPRDKTACRAGCSTCQYDRRHIFEAGGAGDVVSRKEEDGGDWRVIRGKFLAINAATMSCACPRSPKGLSPAAHLADGTTDLILVRKCSRVNFLRHLLRHTCNDDQFDLSFVEVHRVREFRFTPATKGRVGRVRQDHCSSDRTPVHSSWNCDGEILAHASIEVGVHSQLIRLFARGIEEGTFLKDIAPP
ncbi:hypothetical protein GJAV_G00271140 [Gymnothorax javanicus]|nr:hypothetical protein GJAV_G00271140 [Gymnothorax javanicus]